MGDTREQDIYDITHPAMWDHWPVLPMRRNGDREHGVILARQGELLTVRLVDVHDKNLVERLETCEKLIYSSIEEMLDDGWTVD